MDKDVIIAVVLAALILVSLFQTIQLAGISSRLSTTGGATANLSAGSGGETIEEMNERMHGSGSSSASTGSGSSGSAMVGGC